MASVRYTRNMGMSHIIQLSKKQLLLGILIFFFTQIPYSSGMFQKSYFKNSFLLQRLLHVQCIEQSLIKAGLLVTKHN